MPNEYSSKNVIEVNQIQLIPISLKKFKFRTLLAAAPCSNAGLILKSVITYQEDGFCCYHLHGKEEHDVITNFYNHVNVGLKQLEAGPRNYRELKYELERIENEDIKKKYYCQAGCRCLFDFMFPMWFSSKKLVNHYLTLIFFSY